MDDVARRPALEPMPEDWDTALAVVAHPDDMEYGASGAVARWTDQGKTVAYLLLTAGEAGIDAMAPADVIPLREAEQRTACEAVGVTDLEILDHPDGVLSDEMALRHDIAAAVRRVRPDLVITLNHRDTFGPGTLNMADHRVAGQATIDAVRDAANRWVFRDLVDGGLEPWSGVRWVAISGSPQATHAVDVTDTIDRAVASLAAHAVYLDGLGSDHPMSDPGAFLRGMAERSGSRFGDTPCTTFELISM